MLAIRLLRVGKKNQPAFKLVVTEKTRPPRGGRFLEELGYYNPITKDRSVNAERTKHWISVGAQLSATVHNLLVAEKVIEGDKIAVHAKSKKKEEPAKAASPVAEATPEQPAQEGSEETKPEEPVQEEIKAEETPQEEPEPEESKEETPKGITPTAEPENEKATQEKTEAEKSPASEEEKKEE